jgi:hypothetical protein
MALTQPAAHTLPDRERYGERRSNSSLLSTSSSRLLAGVPTACGALWLASGRRLVVGSGVAFPKSRCSGCEAGHAEALSCPRLPSRTAVRGGVGDEAVVERVADASLERADGFLFVLPSARLRS